MVLILFCCVIFGWWWWWMFLSKIRCYNKRTPFGDHFCVSFCPLVDIFFISFSYNIIHLLLLLIINTFVPPFDDDDFEGLRISVLLAKREGVCGSFSLSELLFWGSATREKEFFKLLVFLIKKQRGKSVSYYKIYKASSSS